VVTAENLSAWGAACCNSNAPRPEFREQQAKYTPGHFVAKRPVIQFPFSGSCVYFQQICETDPGEIHGEENT